MKYNDWTLGQVEAVFNKLGGDDGVRRFLAGELVVKPVDRNWLTWKTIKLGLLESRLSVELGFLVPWQQAPQCMVQRGALFLFKLVRGVDF
ncbi:MAG: hypothetical protein CEN87_424 [Parcubacteria group bacterium Licking1014_1]|nr:MAG: hypothetical protein CEN87_424 [Parcubacteria group bacterium Licking1014_1]